MPEERGNIVAIGKSECSKRSWDLQHSLAACIGAIPQVCDGVARIATIAQEINLRRRMIAICLRNQSTEGAFSKKRSVDLV